MSKRMLAFTVLMCASFFVACSQDDSAQQMAAQQASVVKVEHIVKVEPFTAPANPVVTEEQAKLYAKASAGLVELGVSWSEKIEKANDNDKVQMLNAYNVARDQLCARTGLKGGIAEFNWITKVALPDPQNKAKFEAAGIKTN